LGCAVAVGVDEIAEEAVPAGGLVADDAERVVVVGPVRRDPGGEVGSRVLPPGMLAAFGGVDPVLADRDAV
jgi:hypothetical protein